MNFKSFLITSSVASAMLLAAGCSKDEETPYSKKDPRISFVSIKGVNSRIVINDYEHKIYNTDSLAYGTDVSNMSIFFAGYDVSTGIEVLQGGEWIPYTNMYNDSSKFDLSNLKIRSTSVDKSSSVEYTVALRVRNFDVNAFVWNKTAELPVAGDVQGGAAVAVGKCCYYFYTNTAGELLCLCSSNFKDWKNVPVSAVAGDKAFAWSSLVVVGEQVLLPFSGGVLAFSGFPAEGKEADALVVDELAMGADVPTFLCGGIDGNYYAFSSDAMLKKGDEGYARVAALPAGFPTEHVTSIVTNSGSRTRIAYIYGFCNGVASVWALDAAGKLMKLADSNASASLPVVEGATLAWVDNELGLVGGRNAEGAFLNTFYTSADAGLSWQANWHKELPGNVGAVANVSVVSVSANEVVLLGGKGANGASAAVWRASLNGTE